MRAAVVLMLMMGVGCSKRPDPPFREQALDAYALHVTLPGDWRGGSIRGAGFVFVSGPADASLSFNDTLADVPFSEAGARAFHGVAKAEVLASGPARFGPFDGFFASAHPKGDAATTLWFGFFHGPRGLVWMELRAPTRPASEALWRSVISSLR